MTPEARQDRLLVQEVAGELVIYDQKRHRVHRLNKTAALVWRHCDGKTDQEELSALLERDLGLPNDGDLVRLALARLAKAHLLLEEGRPAESATVTRRQVIRKFGLVGALTLLLPAVTSITAPTPARAQSAAAGNGAMCAAAGGICYTESFCLMIRGGTCKNGGAKDCPTGQICCICP